MAKRPRNEYGNWIHLLSETSAVRELLAAELENLPLDDNAGSLKEIILESPEIADRITGKIFDTFIELVGVKILESPDKEFYVPNFGTFSVKTHRGHKMTFNPKEGSGTVVDVPDYKMLRFKPDSRFKSSVLMTDSSLINYNSADDITTDDKADKNN
jgi:nucleoid DNA-binding protein